MTVNDHVVRYQEHVSTKSYEELVAAFEETVPDAGSGEPTRTLERVRDSENSRAAWEAALAPLFGPSGFTRVFSLDTGRSSAGTASRPRVPKLVGVPTRHQPTGRRGRCGYTGTPSRRLARPSGVVVDLPCTSSTEARNQSCLRSSTCRFRLRL